MKKFEYCQQYNEKCFECPCSKLIQAGKKTTYVICRYDLRTVRDNINHILNSERNNET